MRVHVLHFGPLRDARGLGEEVVDVPPMTLRELHRSIFGGTRVEAVPVAFARNDVRVGGDEVVADGDRVVFLPPVGGG